MAPANQPLVVQGDVDIATSESLAERLSEYVAASDASVIVVDLAAVSFMDTVGIEPLEHCHRELATEDRLLALQSPSPAVRRLFMTLSRIGDFPLVRQTLDNRVAPSLKGRSADQPPGAGRLSTRAQQSHSELRDRAVVERAKGLLMGLHECNAVQAWLLLEQISHRRAVDVVELAAGLAAGGDPAAAPREGPSEGPRLAAAIQSALGSRGSISQPDLSSNGRV